MTRTTSRQARAVALGAAGAMALAGTVALAEISGSDTFVHAETAVGELVAQLTGVHNFELGEPVTLHMSPAQAYVFGPDGALLVAPRRTAERPNSTD